MLASVCSLKNFLHSSQACTMCTQVLTSLPTLTDRHTHTLTHTYTHTPTHTHTHTYTHTHLHTHTYTHLKTLHTQSHIPMPICHMHNQHLHVTGSADSASNTACWGHWLTCNFIHVDKYVPPLQPAPLSEQVNNTLADRTSSDSEEETGELPALLPTNYPVTAEWV